MSDTAFLVSLVSSPGAPVTSLLQQHLLTQTSTTPSETLAESKRVQKLLMGRSYRELTIRDRPTDFRSEVGRRHVTELIKGVRVRVSSDC